MDNDDMRRGKPSCHKAFGESTAMLAGDVLLTEAFEAVAGAPAPASVCVHAAQALGAGAGSRGMVYGQELDLKYEALAASEEQLRLIHRHKTGALINASIQMGGAAAQANEVQRKALEAYAYGIGLVFQVVDDVLDVTGTAEQLGKPIGSDSENGKTTFPSNSFSFAVIAAISTAPSGRPDRSFSSVMWRVNPLVSARVFSSNFNPSWDNSMAIS